MSKVYYKSEEEIEQVRLSANVLSQLLGEVAQVIKPGITTLSLDKLAYEFIHDNGGTPAFLNYHGFPYSLCISVNDQIVHGFPSDYIIKDGDLVSVDGGVNLNGFISDSAYTFGVGNITEEAQLLLDVTKESMYKGIEQAVAGKRVGDIGAAIQEHVSKYGFGIVRELVGHGVGLHLHEKPEVPNYGKRGSGAKLESGLVICIEPMINAGKAGVRFWDDGWTVSTVDGKLSAHFEQMVAIRKGEPDVLLTFEHVEKVLGEK
ncbi:MULTISPECIES: type I methionyl aminopeptidase [Sphingobacterium]|mgnify:CR=1 FL=1|jgi:methionyl aminopeptidase|uniref:type I methionyl aminopeptidase n=1 Tax=Sphingobacterium TaxID=28453 RepID=UPI0004E5EF50|nr:MULTISPECIES: type I methionyl aminopeptidase [Sphingobacterium]CDS94900.1 Methionine aminopeptidase [Sphingobacterium sp. PM2-P1-29]SJN23839.1 Methionine aminopeptidase [Sphingobacterium faecium PCAi_F2.5]HCU45493.1 type I methionyl aminopeptidase [Sphingobacterium sp.]PTX10808.1 methionine aminopeptidase type I [Sphingobacterium faecium]UPZ37267.1 type I methionyl aminopeptidase [Sphingobacterium sp. PCS056]